MTVAILVAISLPGPVRAQSSADAAPVILLHPRVATVLQLPDAIEHARVLDRDEIRLAILGDKLYLRPRPGTPTGVEASLEVETGTARWTFRLRVVAHAGDASREIRVVPVEAQDPGESTSEAPPEVPAEPVAPPGVTAPPASAPTNAPGTRPTVGPEPAEEPAEAATAPVATGIRSPRPKISVHAVGALGVTSLDVAGYAPFVARQSSLASGVRLRVARPDAWWSVEANVSGERLGGPVTVAQPNQQPPQLTLKGTWLRGEVSIRAMFGTKWSPSIYAGGGVQAHLRRTEGSLDVRAFSESMPRGVVLVLGIGLQRRVGNFLLGLDVQWREGGPDGYHSASMVWTIGCFLDPD